MPRHIKKTKKHVKRHKKYTRKMRGGDYSNNEVQELLNLGFTNDNIEMFRDNNVNINWIRAALEDENMTAQQLVQSVEETIDEVNGIDDDDISVISSIHNDDDDDIHDLDLDETFNLDEQNINNVNDTLNTTQESITNDNNLLNISEPISDQGSLHSSDLNSSNNSTNTTLDMSTGGKTRKRRKTQKLRNTRKTGKYQKPRKTLKTLKKSKHYKYYGGNCYGSGIGANNYDPNNSIYNTNLLKLFPYKI